MRVHCRLMLPLLSLFLLFSSGKGEDRPAWRAKADEMVLPLIKEKKLNNLVLGVIDQEGKRHIVAYGEKPVGLEKLDGDTIFEIGSITKVFTSLLLAEAVQKKEVKLEDPVRQFLADPTVMPKRGEQEVTLLELATHRSGLARMPGELFLAMANPKARQDPYMSFDEALLMKSLKKAQLKADPKVDYSNFGVGLLGFALTKKLSKSYEGCLRERVLGPLAMRDTMMVLNDSVKTRLIPGHDAAGKSAPNWNFPDTIAGAGALRSTAQDMLTFLEAQMGRTKTPLDAAIATTHIRRADMNARMFMALGWLGVPGQGQPFLWHNGGTGGYCSFTAFCKNPQVGVILLSNRSVPPQTDKIGMALIEALKSKKD